eukprot:10147376-Alexandrium_andersonii.AAC.1
MVSGAFAMLPGSLGPSPRAPRSPPTSCRRCPGGRRRERARPPGPPLCAAGASTASRTPPRGRSPE